MNDKRVDKGDIWEDPVWGTRFKKKSYYKEMTPKNLDKKEWEKQVDLIIDTCNYRKEHNMAYSERFSICKLYRLFYS